MRPQDNIISAYRVHGWTYLMGVPPEGVLSELTGKKANKSIHPCEKMGLARLAIDFYIAYSGQKRLKTDWFQIFFVENSIFVNLFGFCFS